MKEPEFANMVQCSEMIITDGQIVLQLLLGTVEKHFANLIFEFRLFSNYIHLHSY